MNDCSDSRTDVHESTLPHMQMVLSNLVWFSLVWFLMGFFQPRLFTFDKHESEIIINQRINGRYLIPSFCFFQDIRKLIELLRFICEFSFCFLGKQARVPHTHAYIVINNIRSCNIHQVFNLLLFRYQCIGNMLRVGVQYEI